MNERTFPRVPSPDLLLVALLLSSAFPAPAADKPAAPPNVLLIWWLAPSPRPVSPWKYS